MGGVAWLAVFVITIIVFVIRIGTEEGIMTKQFPDQYPEYKKHTYALVPFVW